MTLFGMRTACNQPARFRAPSPDFGREPALSEVEWGRGEGIIIPCSQRLQSACILPSRSGEPSYNSAYQSPPYEGGAWGGSSCPPKKACPSTRVARKASISKGYSYALRRMTLFDMRTAWKRSITPSPSLSQRERETENFPPAIRLPRVARKASISRGYSPYLVNYAIS